MALSRAQIQQFKIDGYLILREVLTETAVAKLKSIVDHHLQARIPPLELEASLRYPGAPTQLSDDGGDTIRRLKMAYQRAPEFADLALNSQLTEGISELLGAEHLSMNPNHHNCVMTKQPKYSSATLWHRDTRYWNFTDKYLINAWFALGDELEANGAMKILPGSHRWEVIDQSLDQNQFLKTDHPDNLDRLKTARLVNLNAGDAVLFSAHCFHAAGNNTTQATKYSVVYTYHGEGTQACADTPSAASAEILIT